MLLERFRDYLNKVFNQVPDSPEMRDLREEMLGNLMSRAMELKEEGLADDEVFRVCIEGLGDYTDTLKTLKTSPAWLFRDKRVQGGVLLALLALLLSVFLYLALGFTLHVWGIGAIIIFPAMAIIGYLAATAAVLKHNFRLNRHATTELILSSYVVIAVTVLFFILAFATPVGAGRAWCVFPALPALILCTIILSFRYIRKKKVPFALWLVEVPLVGVALYLICAAATRLFHPLWILIPASLAVDLLLAAIRVFGRDRAK